MMNEDAELLRRYAAENTESDFAEFVRRHVDFVFACALRRVGGDAHFAEDVAQQVFIAAARDAKKLAAHPVPTGWLFTATRNVAAQLVRTERRRQRREQEAGAMDLNERANHPGADWEQLRPVIDEALDALSEADREAVLLRFFEGKTFPEIGARLRLAENAARMRVERALDKLNAVLGQRGVSSTAAALTIALAGQTTAAAPAGLAAAATAAAVAGGGFATGTATTIFMGITKLQAVIAGAVMIAGTAGWVAEVKSNATMRSEAMQLDQQLQARAAIITENAELRRAHSNALELTRAKAGELERLRALADRKRGELHRLASVPSSGVAVGSATIPGGAPLETYELNTLDSPPRPTFQGPPKYPFELRRNGVQGEATVDLIVGPDGVAHNAFVVDGTHPAFADAALEAVKSWKFNPGKKGGKPVSTHNQVPIGFTLEDEDSPGPPASDKSIPTKPIAWF
jgi:RNA polymerase sigma factor (sigma-70 family)